MLFLISFLVAAWQARPPRTCLPARLFDALRIKIRSQGLARNEAVYVALGVRADGTKEILGLWLEQNEGAKFWLRVMNELKTRGVGDILVAIVASKDGGRSASCRGWCTTFALARSSHDCQPDTRRVDTLLFKPSAA